MEVSQQALQRKRWGGWASVPYLGSCLSHARFGLQEVFTVKPATQRCKRKSASRRVELNNETGKHAIHPRYIIDHLSDIIAIS